MNHTILVVEDEKGLRDAIAIYLRSQNYEVLLAANGAQGLEELGKAGDKIHLAIVDLMMPVMGGLTMIQEVRKNYDFPIIILSARSEEVDKINGLTIGADDYLTKPFSSMELLARVKAQLRRYDSFLEMKNAKDEPDNASLVNRDLSLNPMTKEVFVRNEPVHS